MGFRVGAYAKIWSVEAKSDKWTKLRASISRKVNESGEYKNEWNGFLDVNGTVAAKKAAHLPEGARIRLGEIDETTEYNKDKKVEYVNRKVMSFYTENEPEFSASYKDFLKVLAGSELSKPAPKKKKEVDDGEMDGSEFPF